MLIEVIKSKRKTISIQVKDTETLLVRAPQRASKKDIEEVIARNKSWIDKQIEKAREDEKMKDRVKPLTEPELRELGEKACIVFKERVEYYAPIVGVTYGRVTIRNQRTRWGSCSSKGNLNFNVALMLAPPEVLDYVVVHELCHRLYLNHSKEFWHEVERVLPGYMTQVQWLKENGELLMISMRKEI